MTAGMLDFSSVNNWIAGPFRGTQGVRIIPKIDYDQPTATLGRENSYTSRADALLRLLDLVSKSANVQPFALARVAAWVIGLPKGVPDPFMAIGDDGSISTEWDTNGNSLHVTFGNDSGEVYFCTPGGDEWESSLDATDKISAAMRVIALASSARR
jgi:hypothetical protein